MLDALIGGHQLGETALAAISIVAPLGWIISFCADLYAPGYGTLFGISVGEFDREKADRTAGQMLVTSICVSLLLMGGLWILKEPFLSYYRCTGELYENASIYYNKMLLSALIEPFLTPIIYFLTTDAGNLLVSIGNIAEIAVNTCLSPVLCRNFGIMGLVVGSGGALLLSLLICATHFLRKTNNIHFKLCFDFGVLRTAVKISGAIGCSQLFIGLVDLIMNKVILVSCGISMVAAYSVINLVYGFYEIFGAAFCASLGLASAFQGERNNAGIRNTVGIAVKSTVVLGLVMSVLILVAVPWLPRLYGMETPEVIEASVKAARWMTLASVPYGIAYVMTCLYPTFKRVELGIAMSFLNDFLCPLLLSVPLAVLLGFTGVSIGMGLNAFLVLGLFALWCVVRHGKKGFPLYLADTGVESVSFDFAVTDRGIVEARNRVKAELDKRGCRVEHIELLVEELYGRIMEKNPGKTVLSECALLFDEKYVRLIIRDNGVIFNFSDEDNKVESLNAYTLNCLLERVPSKDHIVATSLNRNGFAFER